MKTKDNTRSQSVALPYIWCEATDFAKIAKQISGRDTPTLNVGDYSTTLIHEMEGLEDIEENLHLIKVPLCLKFSGISVNIEHQFAYIDYDQEGYARAKGIVEAFRPYEVLGSSHLSGRNFYIGLFLLFVAFEVLIPDWMKEVKSQILFVILFAYFAISYGANSVLCRNRIYFRPRDTFLKRNQDKILWSVLTFIGTLFASRWSEVYQYMLTLSK